MENPIISFRKVMALETVKEVPVIPLVSGWVAKFSGIPRQEMLYNPQFIVESQIRAQEVLGYDAHFAYVDSLYIPEAFGCKLSFLAGAIDVMPLDIRTEEDVKAMPGPDIHKDGRLPHMLMVAKGLSNHPGRNVPVLGVMEGPFTTVARILGTEKAMRALFKNRPLIEAMLEKIGNFQLAYGEALAEVGIDGLIMPDPVGSTTMISPKMYKDLVFPSLRTLITGLRFPVILHVCGDTQPILDQMAETGAGILSLDQCMDLGLAKEKIAGRCGIGGNLDPTHVIFLGTPEKIVEETARCLREGGKQGFILMTGCSVPPDTPIQNLRSMVEAARK